MPSDYLHGTAPSEQRRLTDLNTLLNKRSLLEAFLQPGERVIDFGAGLAQLSRAMAKATGVPVVGIERDEAQIAEAQAQAQATGETNLLDLRQGLVEAPPLHDTEWGAFDVAHARFLLEHVRDPLAVVRSMVRAVRVGGRIILEDDDHDILRLWPEPPGFTTIWHAYMRTYDRNGNDPIVGRRLVQLLHDAGAALQRNTLIFFGSCSGEPQFPSFVENIAGVVESAIQPIIELGMSTDVVKNGLASLRDWSTREDAAIWFGLSWACGLKR